MRAIGAAIGHGRAKLRKEFEAKIDKLHSELTAATARLRDEIDRLRLVDQERRELERALIQSNLDASNARIAGALEAATVKLRSEFDVAGDKLRDEFNAATVKLHDEINTKLARLLEKTWEPVGEVLEQFRQATHEQARSELQAAVATLRDEFNTATSKLHTEINTRLARLPLVKTWEDRVHYAGDVVVCDGATYQAKRDTGRPVTSDDWVPLAARGIDGVDGRTPNLRGVFEAYQQYRQFDIVTCDGNCYIARRDDPGLPGHDDSAWQLLARGSRGPSGDVGPRGQKGERGPPGETVPTVVNWTLDHKNYTVIPTMSDGRGGAPLELRGLFEQFFMETQG